MTIRSISYKARVTYAITDVTQVNYSFPFTYLKKTFIEVSLQNGDTSISLDYGSDYTVTDQYITITNTDKLEEGATLIISRNTSTDSIVQWNDGSVLLADDMTIEQIQTLHLLEEFKDYISLNSISSTETDDKYFVWDAKNQRIINVGTPIDDQDVVTKGYLTNTSESFINQQKDLLQQTVNQTAKSLGYATQSSANATLSKAWAVSTSSPDNIEDTESPTGKTQSARTWAMTAKQYAKDALANSGTTVFTGATTDTDGTQGLVPKPTKGNNRRFLCSNSTWTEIPKTDTFTGSTEGLVPSATSNDHDKVLMGNGTWGYSMPEGTVLYYAGSTAPNGWLVCDGSEVSKEEYAQLYAVIGTTYGTATSSDNFVLPNLIDRFAQGSKTVGTQKEAGLPNITGSMSTTPVSSSIQDSTGAICCDGYSEGIKDVGFGSGALWKGTSFGVGYLSINANRNNSIYGNSDTVQPPSLTLLPIIKATPTPEGRVQVLLNQEDNQTIQVEIDGVTYTTNFNTEKGKSYIASVEADEGYDAGVLSVTENT